MTPKGGGMPTGQGAMPGMPTGQGAGAIPGAGGPPTSIPNLVEVKNDFAQAMTLIDEAPEQAIPFLQNVAQANIQISLSDFAKTLIAQTDRGGMAEPEVEIDSSYLELRGKKEGISPRDTMPEE